MKSSTRLIPQPNHRNAIARERLRRRYRPGRVRLLFVGEAPPASGRFFYQADSGLYRAVRDAFAMARPGFREEEFLELFRELGCYLVDLCGRPVDRLSQRARDRACVQGEVRLSKILKQLRPEMVVVVVRSIAANVRRSEKLANWSGPHIELPYPGRWHHHRVAFFRGLIPLLRGLDRNSVVISSQATEPPKHQIRFQGTPLSKKRRTDHPRSVFRVQEKMRYPPASLRLPRAISHRALINRNFR